MVVESCLLESMSVHPGARFSARDCSITSKPYQLVTRKKMTCGWVPHKAASEPERREKAGATPYFSGTFCPTSKEGLEKQTHTI